MRKSITFTKFLNKFTFKGDCFVFSGSRDRKGYGNMTYKKKHLSSHRLMWIFLRGEIPHGMCVLHKCDNPICSNPDHLFLGTNQDNTDDMIRKGRKKTKLTIDQVKEIRRSTLPRPILAKRYGVDVTNISCVRLGKTWKYIK